VRVRSDNPALAFYEKAGFCETQRVPLRGVESPGMMAWVEDPTVAETKLSLVHMAWTG
jgi:ribosomal protein S18 acetylase RimI-like enzyme